MRTLWRKGGFRAEVRGVDRKIEGEKTPQCVQSCLFRLGAMEHVWVSCRKAVRQGHRKEALMRVPRRSCFVLREEACC